MKDGSVAFFKDGFTDPVGKFEYAKVSGDMVIQDLEKFAIFIYHDKFGSQTKIVDAIKLQEETVITKKEEEPEGGGGGCEEE